MSGLAVATGRIDPTKAVLIARIEDISAQRTLLDETVAKNYTWQEVKALVDKARQGNGINSKKPISTKPFTYNAFLPTKVKASALTTLLAETNLDNDTDVEVAALLDKMFEILQASGVLDK